MGTFAVSGSASGIGAAARARLEAAGHEVIGIDLHDAEVVADLSTADGRTRAVGEVSQAVDSLDGLVTSAGVGPPCDPATIVSINYFGTEALITGLRERLACAGDAQVVAVSSNSTTVVPGVPGELVDVCLAGDEGRARALARAAADANETMAMSHAYAGAKTAVARFVRRHAPTPEWAGSGIRLNAIAPGATATPLLQAGLDSEQFGAAIRDFPVPTGAFASPDAIAAWIEQMLIGDGASFMCGAVVFVDGGTDALVRPDAWPATY